MFHGFQMFYYIYKEIKRCKKLRVKENYKMTKHFWKAPNKIYRNENDNNWNFYNTVVD